MVHACACCRLRFSSTGELEYHVRNDHTEQRPFEERQEVVHRYRRRTATGDVRPRVLRMP